MNNPLISQSICFKISKSIISIKFTSPAINHYTLSRSNEAKYSYKLLSLKADIFLWDGRNISAAALVDHNMRAKTVLLKED